MGTGRRLESEDSGSDCRLLLTPEQPRRPYLTNDTDRVPGRAGGGRECAERKRKRERDEPGPRSHADEVFASVSHSLFSSPSLFFPLRYNSLFNMFTNQTFFFLG